MGCALSGGTAGYSRLSFWHGTAEDSWVPRPALPAGRSRADVVVVGAGYTGLWTAYYLAEADPSLRILVLEAEVAGYGASGRNGGWCSALFPASLATLASLRDPVTGRPAGRDAALAQHAAMRETVDEVVRVAAAEGIEADVVKGGTISLARSLAQLRRAEAEVAEAREWGRGEDDLALLDRTAADDVLRARGTVGATYTPDCAAIHPAKLVRGLARVVERRGVVVHERTRVRAVSPGLVTTDFGSVECDVVVRATEGYTPTLEGQARAVVPVHSLMVATAPLTAAQWDLIGLRRRETFTDYRHLLVYGQRTADDRLAFGGRGAPYRLGSGISTSFTRNASVFDRLREVLADLFPEVFPTAAAVPVTHTWGGTLGIPRDWVASVGLDPATGLGWAGGYVGDGVSTTNLAGRTLRDLVLGRSTPLTSLPWVGHRSPSWEPEPLRWAGINAGLRAAGIADAEERMTGRPSVVGAALERLLH